VGVDAADGLVPAEEAADHHHGCADDRHTGAVHPEPGQAPESEADVRRDEDRQGQDVFELVAAHPIRIA
jgi:hypothetical protein